MRQNMTLQRTKLKEAGVPAGRKDGGSVGVEAKLNTVNMMAWVHKECDIIEEEALNFKKHGTAQNRRMNVSCA